MTDHDDAADRLLLDALLEDVDDEDVDRALVVVLLNDGSPAPIVATRSLLV